MEGDGFVFRHALTREAVLAGLLPPERRELAERAWPAVERANPGLPGPLCELAAELAEAAGDSVAAAERLVQSAERALTNGALATAEAVARRARSLAGEADVALAADEVLVHVLGAAGKPSDALRIGRDLVARRHAAGRDNTGQVDLLVALTRAALAAGDLDAAANTVAEARQAAETEERVEILARIDAVAGEVALDRAELEDAERLIRSAVRGARDTGQPAVLCEALLVLGRIMRNRDAPRLARRSTRRSRWPSKQVCRGGISALSTRQRSWPGASGAPRPFTKPESWLPATALT